MAVVVTPSGLDVMQQTGLDRYVTEDADDNTFQGYLEGTLIPQAVTRTKLSVTVARYTADDLTDEAAEGLHLAICYRAAAAALRFAAVQKARGEYAPLLMEDSGAISAAAEMMDMEAMSFQNLAVGGTETSGIKVVPLTSPTRQAWSEANADLLVVNGPCWDDWD